MCVFIILGHPYTAIFSESAVETQLSSKKKNKKLISLITNKLWSFFAILGQLYIGRTFSVGIETEPCKKSYIIIEKNISYDQKVFGSVAV
jgi:hypothetical protein